MSYRNTYFHIKSLYQPGGGWANEDERFAFQQEIRKVMETLGWKIRPDKNGGCDSATKGLQELYFHPQIISGIIAENEIAAIEDAFSRTETFQCYHVDVYEEYLELSDDEYKSYLEKQKEEIVRAVLDLCTTKRKNLYKIGSIAEAIADRFAVNRISDKNKYNGIGISFVQNVIQELVADGHLVTAKTKHGMGLRTTAKRKPSHCDEISDANEQQMKLF